MENNTQFNTNKEISFKDVETKLYKLYQQPTETEIQAAATYGPSLTTAFGTPPNRWDALDNPLPKWDTPTPTPTPRRQ